MEISRGRYFSIFGGDRRGNNREISTRDSFEKDFTGGINGCLRI
jgi:hypothetical protein